MNIRHRYKRIDAPYWRIKDYLRMDHYTEIQPIFKKDGTYFDRETGTVWGEKGGRAFVHPKDGVFKYELALFNHRPLTKQENKSLRVTMRSMKYLKRGDLHKELMKILVVDSEWKELNKIRRSKHSFRKGNK